MPETCLSQRSVLEIAGDQAVDFLQGLVTQDVAAIADGTSAWAALLSPQGKCLFDLMLYRLDGLIIIDCDKNLLEDLERALVRYRLRRNIQITPRNDLGIHVAWSDGTTSDTPCDKQDTGPPDTDPRCAKLGRRWVSDRFAGDPGHEAAWIAHRLELGIMEGAVEIPPKRLLWLEANALQHNGISFTKGCYIGQENMARMHHKAKLRKRLRSFRCVESPRIGDRISAGSKQAGEVICVYSGPQFQSILGVALIRCEHEHQSMTCNGQEITLLGPE